MKKNFTFFLTPSANGLSTRNGSQTNHLSLSSLISKMIVSAALVCSITAGSFAQITAGFELDGNAIAVAPNPPDDWDLISNGTSSAQVNTGIVTDMPPGNDNAFYTGSSDLLDIPQWGWQLFQTPAKDNLLHGGAALYNNDQIYFFGDRYATNGDAQIGFWFFKNAVGPNPDGSFYGTHAVGDILLLSNFVNGGGVSEIRAYEWVGSGGSDGTLNLLNVTGGNLFAIVNSANESAPWSYVPKFGPANIFGPGAFFEGGIDLAGLGATVNPCFTSFLLETRSSQSVSAELKDFLFGSFFTQPQVTVNSSSTCVGGSVTLTATVAGGVGPFNYQWSNGATTASITVSPSATTTYTVTVSSANGCISNPASGTVTINPAPACSINGINPASLICNTGNYTISTSATGTYSWTMLVDGNPPGWGIIGSSTGQTVTFSSGNCGAAGFQVHFTLTVTDANGCTSTCSASFAPGAPACNVDLRPPVTLTCASGSQYLLASYATGIMNPTFEWRRNGTPIGTGINNGTGLDSILVSTPGSYRFTVVDPINPANNCFTVITVLQDTAAPNVTASAGMLTCATTSVNLSAGSTTTGATFSWTGPNGFTSSLQNPAVTAAGNYTVTVTNPANGCTASATATVSSNTNVPVVTATGGELTCATTSLHLAASSSVTGVSYHWTGPNNYTSSLQNPSITIPGNYTVVVTDLSNGCSAMATTTVTQNIAAPNAIASGGQLTCYMNSINLQASSTTGLVSFSWSGPNGFSSQQQNPITTFPGTYTVTVTNPLNGCTTTATATVTQNTTIPNVAAVGGQLNCYSTSINLAASSTSSPVMYIWNGPNGFSSYQQNPAVTAPGTYNVTVLNLLNGCSSTAVVNVSQNISAPSVTATGGQLTCAATSTQLISTSSSMAVAYYWTGPNGYSSTLINPNVTVPGNYTLVVTNLLSGCSSTVSTVVTQNIAAPGVTAVGGQLTCTATSIQLSASSSTSGVNYSWTGPNGFSSSQQNPSVTAAGNYTVVVTNPVNGCTSVATASVSQNVAAPGVTAIGGELTCAVNAIQLSASSSTGGVTYSWSGPNGFSSSQQNPTANAAGNYTVIVTNPVNGCTSMATATVSQNITAPGAAATGGELTCVVNAIQLSASSSTSGVSYNWSGPNGFSSSQQNPMTNAAGSYTVIVTNPANGCTSMASTTVSQNIAAPGASATGGQLNCGASSVQITASSSASGALFAWSGPNGFTSGMQNPTVTVAGTYTVIVTNPANGCTSSATAIVTQSISNLQCYIAPPPEPYCGSSNNAISVSASGGTQPLTYVWFVVGNGWSVNNINSATTTFHSGLYNSYGTFTVIVTDANGCSTTCTRTVSCYSSRPEGGGEDAAVVDNVTLHAFPNPFSQLTTVEFAFNEFSANAEVTIFSTTGAVVASLYKGQAEQGRLYKVSFDASDLAEGIYICRISANDKYYFTKLMLSRD
jgi:hypothetical protein